MKLLYTRKQFQGEMEKALAPLKQELEKEKNEKSDKEMMLLTRVDELGKQLQDYEETIKLQDDAMYTLNCKIDKLIEDKKLLFGAKGGLTKYNNRLKKEIKKIKEELAEANEKLSQRYIVKELEPVKAKNIQVMKTKSGARTSRIIKKVVENEKD